MTAEREEPDIPEWAREERQSDLKWIAENLPSFWPAAQAQFAARGRGVVVIDTTQQPDPNAGHPMYYLPRELAEESPRRHIIPHRGDGCVWVRLTSNVQCKGVTAHRPLDRLPA
jgi:hypothetical protein